MPFTIKDDALNILQRLDCDTVDKIEMDVPVLMLSASGHTAYVNTAVLHIIYDPSKYDSFEDYRKHVNSGGGLQEFAEILPAVNAIPATQYNEAMLGIPKGLDSMFELASQRGV